MDIPVFAGRATAAVANKAAIMVLDNISKVILLSNSL
jgi:hypothetical protein